MSGGRPVGTSAKKVLGVSEGKPAGTTAVNGCDIVTVSSREINLRKIKSHVVNAFRINLSRDQL